MLFFSVRYENNIYGIINIFMKPCTRKCEVNWLFFVEIFNTRRKKKTHYENTR